MNSTQEINALLDLLSSNSAGNSMNGMIHALGQWFLEHITGQDSSDQMRDAYSVFATVVIETVSKNQSRREQWPKGKSLPKFDNKPKTLQSISERILEAMQDLELNNGLMFIGELWGKWLLSCPKELLLDILESIDASPDEISEELLIKNMLRYIDMYGNMPIPRSIPAA
ncbi:MAG: hypothetical protein E4G99_12575 [Anaerolineales bacterium]|nr:MAG: hypothetical protein E4G99_12575 [Anaerolineales bacterium]